MNASRLIVATMLAAGLAAATVAAAAAAPPSPATTAGARSAARQPELQSLLDEQVAAAGVYNVTVAVTTAAHASRAVSVSIGPIVRHAVTSSATHRVVLHQQLRLRGRRLRISARAPLAAPQLNATWRLVAGRSHAALPAGGRTGGSAATPRPLAVVTPSSTGSSGPTGSTAPIGPPNPVQVGINVAATSGNFFTNPTVLAAIRSSDPAWVRVFIGWNEIEPAPGSYNTAEIANYRAFFAALPVSTQLDVDVEGTPSWADGGAASAATPPTEDSDYAAFLSYLVGAFGGRVSAWEIWNEEDSPSWWSGTPAQYVSLLKAAYGAVKSADPAATVILGGLTGNDATYLGELYAAGAQGSFDAVGVHTDTACNIAPPTAYEFDRGTQTINQYFFLGFTAVHATMVANGDAAKPIYLTELGWSTTAAECETGAWAGQKVAGVDDATQATYLQQAYNCLAQPQYSYIKAAMWFELVDNATDSDPLDNFGLFTAGLAAKPAFAVFQQDSLDGVGLSGPCGP